MSKQINKQTAEKLFAATTHDVLWANPKGEFFTSENIGKLSLKKDQKLEKFERPQEQEVIEVVPIKLLGANDSIAKIQEATTLEELLPFETDKRTTVIAAYNKQHEKLLAEIEVTTETVETGKETGSATTEGKQ